MRGLLVGIIVGFFMGIIMVKPQLVTKTVVVGMKDSVIFDCVRCGWKHKLEIKE